jgi:hypothetical protein
MLLKFTVAGLAMILTANNAVALAQSHPITSNEVPRPIEFLARRSNVDTGNGSKSVNDCSDSTFENNSGIGSPLTTDCLRIATNIAGGTWKVETVTCRYHQLVQFGTCAFCVTVCANTAFVNIGNQDIMDLIHESVPRFEWNGSVSATGRMQCQSGRQWVWTDWNIYHD